MKKQLLATAIALYLSTGAAHVVYAAEVQHTVEEQQPESTNDMIGFGSGALAGAVVAGPVGAVVGAIFGLLIADDINGDKQIKHAKLALEQANIKVQKQQQSFVALQSELTSLQQQNMRRIAAFDEQNQQQISQAWLNDAMHFETNLQFKTASFLIENIYQEQLDSLAAVLVTYPQLSVNVNGYADQRGDSQFNKTLSEQRAIAVQQYLINKGVLEAQINTAGMGETAIHTLDLAQNIDVDNSANKQQTNIEDLFFARKVKLNLVLSAQHMTAAN